jgi:hypothetical protein
LSNLGVTQQASAFGLSNFCTGKSNQRKAHIRLQPQFEEKGGAYENGSGFDDRRISS